MSTANASDLVVLLAQLAQAIAANQAAPPAVPEPRPVPERVLLTVEEAAERLGIGRTFAWRLVSAGELESVLIGRLRRVPVTAVSEYAARLVDEQTSKRSA